MTLRAAFRQQLEAQLNRKLRLQSKLKMKTDFNVNRLMYEIIELRKRIEALK